MAASKQDLFKIALQQILIFEGGYVNHPNDKGGSTNYGIIQTTYDSYRLSKELKKQSVKNISAVEVSDIYYSRYWLPSGCDGMPSKLAVVVFDTAVNMGLSKPVEYLQELIGTKQRSWNARLANDLKFYLSKHSEDHLLVAFLERRETSYRRFASKPGQKVFLQGWLNRVQHLKSALKEVA